MKIEDRQGRYPKVIHELGFERRRKRFIKEQELGLQSFLAEVIIYVKTTKYEMGSALGNIR